MRVKPWSSNPQKAYNFRTQKSTYSLLCSLVPVFANQKIYYRILTKKLVNQKKELQRRLSVNLSLLERKASSELTSASKALRRSQFRCEVRFRPRPHEDMLGGILETTQSPETLDPTS